MSDISSTSWPFPQAYKFGELSLLGNSLAGQGTSFLCPELRIAFDVAFGLPYLLPARDFFISHAHMDHAGGIPYLISQKNLMNQPTARFYVPKEMRSGIVSVLNAWQEMEGHEYDYQMIGVEPGDWIPLKGNWGVRAFKTVHRVPSLGYTLFRTNKHLKPEFQDLSRQELLDLKSRGEELSEFTETPYMTFTGDTQIEFLDSAPWVKESKLLIMEVTYIDNKKTVSAAREWGHIHFDELVPRLKDLKCEKLLLIHLSGRYKSNEFEAKLKRELPEEWQGRIDVFSRD